MRIRILVFACLTLLWAGWAYKMKETKPEYIRDSYNETVFHFPKIINDLPDSCESFSFYPRYPILYEFGPYSFEDTIKLSEGESFWFEESLLKQNLVKEISAVRNLREDTENE